MLKSGHKFVYGTTAELSWHVQICDLIESSEAWLKDKELSPHFNYDLWNHLWEHSRTIPTAWIIQVKNKQTTPRTATFAENRAHGLYLYFGSESLRFRQRGNAS